MKNYLRKVWLKASQRKEILSQPPRDIPAAFHLRRSFQITEDVGAAVDAQSALADACGSVGQAEAGHCAGNLHSMDNGLHR